MSLPLYSHSMYKGVTFYMDFHEEFQINENMDRDVYIVPPWWNPWFPPPRPPFWGPRPPFWGPIYPPFPPFPGPRPRPRPPRPRPYDF